MEKKVLWDGEGITKLQDVRRWVWVWRFEEVSLVIGAGLVTEFVKPRHPILRLWEKVMSIGVW